MLDVRPARRDPRLGQGAHLSPSCALALPVSPTDAHSDCSQVASSNPEFTHSGIWGGVTSEPLNDLIRVLASLTDSRGAVRIPGFLDGVRKLLPSEQKLYDELFQRTDGCVRLSSPDLFSQETSRLTLSLSARSQPAAASRRQGHRAVVDARPDAVAHQPVRPLARSDLLDDLPNSLLTPPSPPPAAGANLRSRSTRSRCPARRRRRSSPTRRRRACRSGSCPTRASTTSSRCSRRTSRSRSALSRRPTRSRCVLVPVTLSTAGLTLSSLVQIDINHVADWVRPPLAL